MPIDANTAIIALALSLGAGSMAISVLYLLPKTNRMTLDISSNAENIEKLNRKLDQAMIQTDGAMKDIVKMHKSVENGLIKKIDSLVSKTATNLTNMDNANKERMKMVMAETKKQIDKLDSAVDGTNQRLNQLTSSMIDAQYKLKVSNRNTETLANKMNIMKEKVTELSRSNRDLIRKLNKVDRMQVRLMSKQQLNSKTKRRQKTSRYKKIVQEQSIGRR